MAPPRTPFLPRLMDKFTVGDGCWEWIPNPGQSGYGRVHVAPPRVRKAAHVAVYEVLVGPVPEGMELDHLCRNKICVRPSHLEPVTHRENLRRSDLVTGKRSARTECPKGHPYDETNTRMSKEGKRCCRACARIATAEYRAKLRR